MTCSSDIEKMKHFVLEHELPQRETALFGVLCPYCGKSDRIRVLEVPEDLDEGISEEQKAQYSRMWHDLTGEEAFLGICRFCTNILKLSGQSKKATPFDS